MLESLAGLREGAGLLVEGIRFLKQRRAFWGLAFVPVFFAFLLTSGGLVLYGLEFDALRALVADSLPVPGAEVWWHWLWVGPARAVVWLLGWAAMLLALVLTLLVALLLANLLAAPFLDRLSEKIEAQVAEEEGLPRPAASSEVSVLGQALRSFGAELQRTLFLASIGLGLALVGFLVPGAHFLTGPLFVLTTVLFLPLDYAGFALDRRGASFRSRRAWLRAHRPLMVGFGGVAFVACLIPGLNLLMMPALVAAGTLLVARRPPEDTPAP